MLLTFKRFLVLLFLLLALMMALVTGVIKSTGIGIPQLYRPHGQHSSLQLAKYCPPPPYMC
jgi:hypothetical protein